MSPVASKMGRFQLYSGDGGRHQPFLFHSIHRKNVEIFKLLIQKIKKPNLLLCSKYNKNTIKTQPVKGINQHF